LATGQGSGGEASIYARLVQRQRVFRDKHTDVGQYGSIVLGVAVAVGRYILH
jgi:hypothetical protein